MPNLCATRERMPFRLSLLASGMLLGCCLAGTEVPVVTPGTESTQAVPGKAPSDAIVLFDGSDLSKWVGDGSQAPPWKVANGYMEVVPDTSSLWTKEQFGDCQLHVEWAAPAQVQGDGQGRGNSGVILMGRYEVQVLDCYENATYADGGAAAIYGQEPPLVNCCRKPGAWQEYDIVFRRPHFGEGGKLTKPAFLTVFHNGVVVHHDSVLFGPMSFETRQHYQAHPDKQPLLLQNHGNPVRYRNLWIRPLSEEDGRDSGAALERCQTELASWPWKVNDTQRPRPPVVAPGAEGSPPADASVLFEGGNLAQWAAGAAAKVSDGSLVVKGELRTKDAFGDCQVHVEWTGSAKRAGLRFLDRYEVQLDDPLAAIRRLCPPLALAARGSRQQQTCDLVFSRARSAEEGRPGRHAHLTVLVNGVLVQDAVLPGVPTNQPARPVLLRDDAGSVRFRNVWARELAR